MKKIRKTVLSIFAFCLLIPCMFLFSACGESETKAYNVKGLTLTLEDKCTVVYEKGITSEQKQQVLDDLGPYNAEAESLSEDQYSIKFNNDNTASIGTKTYYYTQSSDLKTVTIYSDEEKTTIYHELQFINGNFCWEVESIENIATIYFTFSK